MDSAGFGDIVGIETGDDVGTRMLNPAIGRCRRTEIFCIHDQANARVALDQTLHHCALVRTVVDDDELEVLEILYKDALDRGIQKTQVVMNRHDDGDAGSGRLDGVHRTNAGGAVRHYATRGTIRQWGALSTGPGKVDRPLSSVNAI